MTRQHNHRDRSRRPSNDFFQPLEPRQMFAAGALDASFSGDGLATVDFGPGITVSSRDVAVQADGKTVVVGAASNGDIALARFNTDGSLDTTFGAARTGKVLTHVGLTGLPCYADAVTIMPSGNIVIAGRGEFQRPSQYGTHWHSMVLVRYTPGGTLTQYNAIEQTNFGRYEAEASDVAVQADGKIVVAGSAIDDVNSDMFVARFNSNFAADESFNGNGVRFIGLGGDDRADSVAIDYSGTPTTNPRYGSILVVGTNNLGTTSTPGIAIARVTARGKLDGSFTDGLYGIGRSKIYIPGASSEGHGVLVQPDGKVVVTGTATFTSPMLDNKFTVARLAANGKPDASFGDRGKGWAVTDLFGDDRALDVIRSFDGKLLVGGSTNGKFAVIQYTSDGLVDRSFGTRGYTISGFADRAEIAGVASGPGRRFVATGGNAFHTARYLDASANLVTLGAFNTSASEQGPKSRSFIVGRTERLPYATRVYLQISGSAQAPSGRRGSTPDYALEGLTIPPPFFGGSGTPFVDIPANQTFVLVTLTPRDDALVEGTETATFSIAPNASYELGTPAATTINIADNDGVGINPRLGRRTLAVTRPVTTAPRSPFAGPTAPRFSQQLISELL